MYLDVFKHEALAAGGRVDISNVELPRAIFDLKDLTDIKSSSANTDQTRNVGPDIAEKHRKMAESRADTAKRPPGPSGLNPNGRSLRGPSCANTADVSVGPNSYQHLSNVAWFLALMSFSSYFSIQWPSGGPLFPLAHNPHLLKFLPVG